MYSLKMCRVIDAGNRAIGLAASWLVLLAVLISSGNALSRYWLDTSSNAWLELQWYLFSAIALLPAGYALLSNQHVRIDVLYVRLSPRVRSWIDVWGGVLFLLPVCLTIGILSWPMFVESFVRHEMSGDAGGLLRWPVKLLIPLGFLLLVLQGISEILKHIAFLRGVGPDPAAQPATGEESPYAAPHTL